MRRILHHHNIFPINGGRILHINNILPLIKRNIKPPISPPIQSRFAPVPAISMPNHFGFVIVNFARKTMCGGSR